MELPGTKNLKTVKTSVRSKSLMKSIKGPQMLSNRCGLLCEYMLFIPRGDSICFNHWAELGLFVLFHISALHLLAINKPKLINIRLLIL